MTTIANIEKLQREVRWLLTQPRTKNNRVRIKKLNHDIRGLKAKAVK